MPEQYEQIRDSYVARGKPLAEAKRIAAQTYIKRGQGGSRSSRAKALQHGRKPFGRR